MKTPTPPERLAFLRQQANTFRQQVADAQARVDALSVGHPFNRSPGVNISLNAARDDLDGARQGLRNAERVLAIAESLWGDQGRAPPEPTL